VKHGGKTTQKPVAVSAAYNPSTQSINMNVRGKVPFTKGGQLIVNASPSSGIIGTSGVALDGNNTGMPGDNATFTVLAKELGIIR
jgi:hypothetical protein